MKDVCEGVQFMHQQGVSHRDLKVENILLKNTKFKIADFGSAETSENFLIWENMKHLPQIERNKQINNNFDFFEANTTLMYRPPEMIDRYLKYNVEFSADIWMMGCILFTLCYAR